MAERVAALEAAAHLLLSPPLAVPEQDRKAAELTFLEFKRAPSPYAECKNILDVSSVPYLRFIALSTMKDALLREWSSLPKQLPQELLVYLVHFVQGSTEESMSYITREALHLIAVIAKRQMTEGKQALQDTLTLSHSLLHGNPQQQHLALALLSAVLSEFGSTAGPGQKGLTLDFLVMCKREIEGREMLEVFNVVLQILRYFATMDVSSAQVDGSMFSSALDLAGLILDWDYSHRLSTTKGFASRELYLVPFKPPAVWANTLLQQDVVQLFFKVTLCLHGDETLFSKCVHCLSQLASLTGVVMATTEDAKQGYLQRYMQHLSEYLSRPSLTTTELCGVTAVARRLLDTFPPSTVALVDERVLNQFCSTVSAVSMAACHKVAQAQTLDAVGDSEETLESVLGIWARLISIPHFDLRSHLGALLEAFLKSKLAAPDGWRDVLPSEEEVTAVEIAEGDLSSHSDQLLVVSLLSLEIPSLVLPLLIQLVGSRVIRLTQFCNLVTSHSQAPPPLDPSLITLYEDLHWLALISGHILANPSPGEASLVPEALMHLSVTTPSCPLPSSLLDVVKMEAPPLVESADSYQKTMSSVDPVVALPAALLQCSHVCAVMATAGMGEALSPQLAETLSWFESLWAKTYLHLNEKDYTQVSMSLLGAISPDSIGFSSLLLYLLDKACVQLGCWSGEESLCLNLCALLRTLLQHPTCWSVAAHSQPLMALLQHCVNQSGPVPSLTPNCQRELHASLVMATAGKTDSDAYVMLVQGCLSKLALLLSSPTLPEDAQTRGVLCYRLEALCGLLDGVRPSQVEDVFKALHGVLSSLSELLQRLAGFGEVILLSLDVFRLLAERFLPHLAETQSCQLFELSLSLLTNYASSASSKYQEGHVAEEEQCEDLVVCFRMLKNLTTKDFIDFADTSESLSKLSGRVVLEGLRTVLPLISEPLLQYPMFCSAYYDLISHVCELFADVVLTLEDGFFATLTGLVEVGLTRFGSDVGKQCLESVAALASHCLHQDGSMQVPRTAASMQHFLKVLLQLVLSCTLDSDLTVPLCASLFTLLGLVGKDVYQGVVVQLLQENDPSVREKLLKAFQELLPSEFELTCNRVNRQKFSKRFQTILNALGSFMYIL